MYQWTANARMKLCASVGWIWTCAFCSCSKTHFRLAPPICSLWEIRKLTICTGLQMSLLYTVLGLDHMFKGNTRTMSVKIVFWTGSTMEGKKLFPFSANSFVLDEAIFRRALVSRRANRKLQKISPLLRMAENPPCIPIPWMQHKIW